MDNTNESVELDKVQAVVEELAKSLKADDSLEVLAKGADQIVEQNKALIAEFSKSMADLVAKVEAISTRLDALTEVHADVKKSLNEISTQPVVKAVVTADVAPLDTKPAPVALSKSMVSQRAIAELASTTDRDRLSVISRSIAQLDSGFHPSEVARNLGYTF
jgi:hypothetical protein